MEDFERFEGVNLGGARQYQFAPMDDISVLPIVLYGSCVSDAQFIDGKRWLNAYSTEGTIKVTEKPKQEKSGESFTLKVVGFYPKQSPEALTNLMKMHGRKFAVLIFDNNGMKRLFLNMRFQFTPVSQSSVKKRPGYQLLFYKKDIKPAPFCNF